MLRFKYPESPRSDETDLLHGVSVPDPYRWLEEIDSPQTQAWIKAQNCLTEAYIAELPSREAFCSRITELWDYEKYGVPFQRGNRIFFTRNDGLQNQNVLYWMENLEAEPVVLLDPNRLSEDGTVALTGYAVSEDGKLLAYGLSASGSDWQEWSFRQVDGGLDLPDHLQWVKFANPAFSPALKASITAATTPRQKVRLIKEPIIFISFTITASALPRPKMSWFTNAPIKRIGVFMGRSATTAAIS